MGQLVGRPGPARSRHAGVGRADERRGTLELAPECRYRGQAIEIPRDGKAVAPSVADAQRFACQRLGLIEVAELALDHAEVVGFDTDGGEVPGLAGERDPLP